MHSIGLHACAAHSHPAPLQYFQPTHPACTMRVHSAAYMHACTPRHACNCAPGHPAVDSHATPCNSPMHPHARARACTPHMHRCARHACAPRLAIYSIQLYIIHPCMHACLHAHAHAHAHACAPPALAQFAGSRGSIRRSIL